MSLSDLFKLNLEECKPLVKKTPDTNKAKSIPIHQLFSINPSEPVAAAVNQEEQNKHVSAVPSLLSFKPAISRDVKPTSELEQVKSLNAKYLQVINQINEELTKVKSDATKTTVENASLKKENNDLNNKVSELSNAVLNVVQQNKTLSRALGLR